MRLLPLMIVFCLLAGCFARGGVSGELSKNLEASVEAVHRATLDSLQAQELTVEEESADKQTSLVKARYADGKLVTIHSERFTDSTSKVTIQIGAFGDDLRSQALMQAIEGRLGK